MQHALQLRGLVLGEAAEQLVVGRAGDGVSWEVGWVRNVRAAAEVELRRGGTAERCLAQEATTDEAVPVLRSYLRQFRLVVGP